MNQGAYIIFVLAMLRHGVVEGTNCTNSCEDVPDLCSNHGTCYLNTTTCQHGCYCSSSFSGQRCELVTDDITTTTTLRPSSERQCVLGFECIHGYCDKDGPSFSCVCDYGWDGAFCETFQCPLNCPNSADCVLGNDGFQCKEKVTTTKQPFSTQRATPNLTTTTSLPTTTLRPSTERQCVLGFECIHGYCDKDGPNFSCVCDYGWDGAFCETFQCPLNCPNSADCVLGNDGFQCKEKVTTTKQPFSTQRATPNLTTTTSLPTTTLRPISERQCVRGFECIHGYCKKDGSAFFCSCDDGWEGFFCHRFICPLDCPSNTDCIMVGDTFKCKTKETTTTPSTTPSRDTPSTLKPSPVSTDNSIEVHACSANYTKRPLSERQCMPNFVCEYGVCEMTEGDIGAILECVCDDGGSGGLCQDLCCMPCSKFGHCKTLSNGTEFCQCQFNYEGDLCEMKEKLSTPAPSSTEVALWPLWVSAIVLVCLIVAAVLLFFWMWRNRVTIVMKIVHYFQAYEDDDEKTWDAFVSYKSADIDQKFVLNTLFPKLEKELGFTLCLHHRDFLPGETIANNIINAIDNSRRTILILTPRYVTSEFTRFEYQVAQHEMLKRKHKIIPILLEDIADVNDNMDPNLKQIIKSVTYLAYPGADSTEKKIDHFWKKLTLSMPKKRATEERQKQQKEKADEKGKKNVDVVDKYHDDVEGKLGKNGLGNPAFVTDVVLSVEDEQKIHENEKELIGNLKGINIIDWTHL
ncbi:neurogenic locus notch homolog protein 2-like [Mizuhopecten yessoensis]|uniref:Protein toll n=1 Tax=Mizuhopecten yessoensis TaxID=6573 RepID=A0A210PI26_MIZYE|nr:neurogenic locus notch homolog protein 2-like [Mizuhopecten yessoensis]OWF36139.1 Protein toll [Mizuhopecten yessoensis]